MSFKADIAKFSKGTTARIHKVIRTVTFALFAAVTKDTPVDSGRLKNNWMISVGAPDLTTTDVGDYDKSGARKTSELFDFTQSMQITGDLAVYLTNSLPYAARIEFDGWSHTKAPLGMVRRNLARFNRIVDERGKALK